MLTRYHGIKQRPFVNATQHDDGFQTGYQLTMLGQPSLSRRITVLAIARQITLPASFTLVSLIFY